MKKIKIAIAGLFKGWWLPIKQNFFCPFSFNTWAIKLNL